MKSPTIEARTRAILSPSRRLPRTSRLAGFVTLGAALLVTAPCAALQVGPDQAQDHQAAQSQIDSRTSNHPEIRGSKPLAFADAKNVVPKSQTQKGGRMDLHLPKE